MIRLLFFVTSILLISACGTLPNVYLVDRHTILESEASGEWPIIENRFIEKSISPGPVAFKKDDTEKKPAAHILLNAELAAGTHVSGE